MVICLVNPMMVHFPIALISAGILFETIDLYFRKERTPMKCGEYLLYLATLTLLIATLTGIGIPEGLSSQGSRIHSSYLIMGLMTTFAAITASLFYGLRYVQKRNEDIFRKIGYSFYWATLVLGFITTYLVNSLVYNYQLQSPL